METESKYLKQIRDELKKKNGDTGHSLYNDSNAKAKYLRDIAKEIQKFDVDGGGGIFLVNGTFKEEALPYDNFTSDKSIIITTDKTSAEIQAAYNEGKLVILKSPFTYSVNPSNKEIFIYSRGLFYSVPTIQYFHPDTKYNYFYQFKFMAKSSNEFYSGRNLLGCFVVGDSGPEILPYVTDDDNGKILQVVNGKWTAVTANLESHELHGAITSEAESNNGIVSNSINGTYTVVEDGGES